MDKASIAIAKIMRLTEYVITAGIARERSKTYFAVKEPNWSHFKAWLPPLLSACLG